MDKSIINAHDKFFKYLFSQKEEVCDFISNVCPKELVNKLDLSTLELSTTEYINKDLKVNFSDIVYNCTYGKDTKINISLLFEHKSYPEKYPHLQLLSYMLNMWQTQIKQNEKLTPVIPIIFYHGSNNWKKLSFNKFFKGLDDDLLKFIPMFDYLLVDTSELTNKQIKDLFKNLQLQIGLLVMKNIFNEQKILNELTDIFANINTLLQDEQGNTFLETITTYLYYKTNIKIQKIAEKMKTISPQAEKTFISTAERLIMQGNKEGMEKVAFSMLKENFDDKIIIKVTSLSQERLDYLKTLDEYIINY